MPSTALVNEKTAENRLPVPSEDLAQRIVTLYASINRANAQLLKLIGEFDEREGAARLGFLTTAHWLNYKCGIGLTAGREKVRVARALGGLPAVSQSFAEGRISYSKVRALTRVATSHNEATLLDIAHHATAAQAERIFRQYRQTNASAEASKGTASASASQSEFACHWDEHGNLVFRGRLAPELGALVLAAMRREQDSGVERGAALGEIARRALSTESPDAVCSSADRYQVHIELGDASADSAPHSAPHLRDGPGITDALIERLTCDASLIPHQPDQQGEPLNVGRKTRTVSSALRRALIKRDGGCRFPGCTNRYFVDAHHVQHWAHGGETSLSNLLLLCPAHHTAVHERGFRIEVETPSKGAVRFRFYTPQGEYLPPVADDLSQCEVVELPGQTATDASAEASAFGASRQGQLNGSPLEPLNPTPRPDYEHINWVLTNFHRPDSG